jgi:hypothetical protein
VLRRKYGARVGSALSVTGGVAFAPYLSDFLQDRSEAHLAVWKTPLLLCVLFDRQCSVAHLATLDVCVCVCVCIPLRSSVLFVCLVRF